AGVTVAVIDSGITSWHDDLTNNSSTQYPYGNQRVAAFVDFVNGQTQPYDDDGHGTHVAGIIAGNGYDSNGQKAGVAPDASLVSLKVLDGNGNGTISNIIGAFDWVVAHHAEYNIRVVNASVGASISESYWTDPLTLAAKRVVDEGVVVVTAAGNVGLNGAGQTQYGGITAPGNAPWVITVGASSTNGTPRRDDDTMGSFSSRGPTFKDWGAKPDLVAPGVGTISLANPQSNYYTTRAQALVPGSLPTAFTAYLSLSGTSMASPVVAGTVALMLQANPSLTPNAVKAILEYTAETHADYDALTQGAGFLNTLGAVRLARFYAGAQPGDTVPVQAMWSKHVLWGNHMLHGGILNPAGNAFGVGVNWGVSKSDDGDNIVWGTDCSSADCDNIVWGTADGDNIVWGTSADGDNIVWGTDCGGADCDNIVWGTDDGDNIVWGTSANGVTNWAGGNGNVVAGNFQGLLKHKTDEQIFAILEQVVSGPPPSALPAAPTTNNDPLQLPPSDPATTSNDPLQLPPPDPNVIDPSLAPPPPALSPDPIVVNQSLPCDPTVALCTAPPCDPTTTACTSTGGGL
ncbi:MAG TPA: S8 family peptidase, partial [Vicinamibacterales bacterium]|nr:S8 family peptidase [Vicinamibacterales bacterium]